MRQDEGCPCHPEEEEVEAGEEHCSGEAVILFVQNCLENIQDKDFYRLPHCPGGSSGGFVYIVDVDESRWSKIATRDVKASNNFDVATGMLYYRTNTEYS